MNADHLLETAQYLTGRQSIGRPRQVDLKRAISTVYYALFHALALCCADTLATQTRRGNPAWQQAYRAIEHGHVKKQCMNKAVITRFSQELQDFGKWFVYMQILRHRADYDPVARFTRSEVLDHLGSVEDIIKAFSRVSLNERREFAIFVLFQIRK